MGLFSFLNPIIDPIVSGVSDLAGGVVDTLNPLYQKLDSTMNQGQRDFAVAQQEDAQQFNAEQSQLQRDFSAQQNLLAMQFNSSEAQKAREWSSEENVLKRQLASGINPLSADSSGFMPDAASINPASGAEASSSPLMPQSFVNPVDTILKLSQAALNASKTKTENLRRPWVVENDKMSVSLAGSQIELNKKQQDEIDSKMALIGSQISQNEQSIIQSKAYVSLLGKQGDYLQKQIDSYQSELESRLSEASSRTGLNEAGVKKISSEIMLNVAKAAESRSQVNLNNEMANTESFKRDNLFEDARLKFHQGQVQQDLHVLNGVQVAVVSSHKKALCTYLWNSEKKRYDVQMKAYDADVAKNLATIEVEGKKARLGAWRNRNDRLDYEIINAALDDAEILTSTAGALFSGIKIK